MSIRHAQKLIKISQSQKQQKMSNEDETINIQQKQKFLRENIDPDNYEDFADFFAKQANTDNLDIGQFSFEQLRNIVYKFNQLKAKEQQQEKHQRSFAIYQTAGIQQGYDIIANTVQNNMGQFQTVQNKNLQQPQQYQTNQTRVQSQQNSLPQHQSSYNSKVSLPAQNKVQSPKKANYPSASDLLDSVMSESQRSLNFEGRNSPQVNNSNMQSKYRSNSQIMFEKGNIWATTANIQNQKKSNTDFNNFWQFSSNVNTMANMNRKQQFKTESPFSNQAFDFLGTTSNNNKTTFSPEVPNKNDTDKQPQPVPSFQQLTKNLTMNKKPNTFGSGHVEPPSNMKKPQKQSFPVKISAPQVKKDNLSSSVGLKKTNDSPPTKEIKLISQKPLNQSSLASLSNQSQVPAFKPPAAILASAYKNNKIPYKGPTVHKSDFKDFIKCYQAPIRNQLNGKKIEVSIQKHEIIEKNFFVGDYVMYHMNVKPFNIVCKRNYEDFTKLKTALQKFYPGTQLPWLEKNSWFQTNQENIKKQKVMLQFFINDLIKNPEIKNSRIFEDFLTLEDHKKIKRKFQEYAKMDQYKALQELCITTGKVEVVVNETQRIYHENLDKLLEEFQEIMGRKNKLIELLGTQFVQVSETLTQLSKVSTQMGEQVKKFNQTVQDYQIPTLQNTFSIISKSFQEWASRISFESKVVNKRLVPFYKFQKDNLQTMRSLLETENSFYKSYMKRSSNQGSNDTYTSSSLKSYKTGILQESRNFTVLKYQLGYLSNMVCKESVRFFELMSENFKAKWIYQAQKYNERLMKQVQFYTSISAMAR